MSQVIKSEGLPVEISEEEVLRSANCVPGTESYEIFRKEYRGLLYEIIALCEPAIYLKEGVFPEDFHLEGLRAGDRVLYVMYTVGRNVSRRSTEAFSEDDYIQGLLIDAMADSALFAMEKSLRKILKRFCREHEVGIGERYSASDETGMELQQLIFENLEGEKNGFSLSSGYMFDPVKTNAMVFKLTADKREFHIDHDCAGCSNFSCGKRDVSEIVLTVLKGSFQCEYTVKTGKNLLDLLRENGNIMGAPCGGAGRCGKCLVQIRKGKLPPDEKEKERIPADKLREGWRLACCAVPQMNMTVYIPEQKEESFQVIAGEQAGNGGSHAESEWGIAVDIGTTTLAMHKVDLPAGKITDTWTGVNHQAAYGADVISRIESSLKGAGANLKECIQKDLYTGISALISRSGRPELLRKVCIAGNTVMFHLLRGYDCRGLSCTPFTPVSLQTEIHSLQELTDGRLPDVPAVMLPGIASFVGADITAGIYACGMDQSNEICMLIDVGTNGEMVLGNKEKLLCASTAAGPAFEGCNISCGMGSLPGAIQSISIREGQVFLRTIQGEEPRGICGTGVLDAAAELCQAGVIDETGLLEDEYFEDGYCLYQSGSGEKVVLTQKDIREIQLAKSAIRAGIETLLKEAGIRAEEVKRIFLAGGFGFYIDLEKAFRIGMFPAGFADRIETVGNSSVSGCIRCLEDAGWQERMQSIKTVCQEVDLSVSRDFQNFFIDCMLLTEE